MINLMGCGGGGGGLVVVNLLTFYNDDSSLNPAKIYTVFSCKIL